MKKYIILFLFFISNIASLQSIENDDSTFVKRGQLRIVKSPFFYEIQIFGNYVISDNQLIFYPKFNKQFVKDIIIPIDSISKIINKPMKPFLIEMNNGCMYKIVMNGKRFFFKKAGYFINSSKSKKVAKTAEDYNVKIRIDCLGSTIYSPLIVKGVIKKYDETFIFTPVELNCFLKTIEISKREIKRINKKGKNKFIIKLNSGQKYIFRSSNRMQLLHDLGL